MKLARKLGFALGLAVACLLTAPAVPFDPSAETRAVGQEEASPRKRKVRDFFFFYHCLKKPCPASDDECCIIREA